MAGRRPWHCRDPGRLERLKHQPGPNPSSPSSCSTTGMLYSPVAQAPRSWRRQRSEQKGRKRLSGVHVTGVPQQGQLTTGGGRSG